MTTDTRKNLLTSASELKLSIVLAVIATVIVCATAIWSVFFSKPTKTNPPIALHNQSVSITEKPKSLQKPSTQPSHIQSTTLSHNNKTTASNNHKVLIGKGDFFVQVGAFKEVVRAKATYEKMRKTYKRAQIMPKSGYYAIWVGPVRSKREAETLQKQILKRYNIKGFITTEK